MITTIQPPTPQHNPELERQHQLEQTVTRLDAGLTLLVLLEQSSPATLSEFDPMGIGYGNVPMFGN